MFGIFPVQCLCNVYYGIKLCAFNLSLAIFVLFMNLLWTLVEDANGVAREFSIFTHILQL